MCVLVCAYVDVFCIVFTVKIQLNIDMLMGVVIIKGVGAAPAGQAMA